MACSTQPREQAPGTAAVVCGLSEDRLADLLRVTFVLSWPVQLDDHTMDLPALQDCPVSQLLWLLLDRLARNWHMEGREVTDNFGFWCLARICI